MSLSSKIVWLPMNPVDGWRAIADVARDLFDAGYPGCLGCGGPHDEGEWDEHEPATECRLVEKNLMK